MMILFLALLLQDRPDVSQELQAYYEHHKPPPWEAAVEKLSSGDPAAAVYLRALLENSQRDERSGKAPWHATPFWGSSGENPARNLRKDIASALAGKPVTPATVQILRWYLEREWIPPIQSQAMAAVSKADLREADELLLQLASKPHENSDVLVKVLGRIAERKLPLPRDLLADLEGHPRRSIRVAASVARKALGHPEPPAFDPVAAVQSKPIRKLMDEISKVVLDVAPADAPFVEVVFHASPKREEESSSTGWRLADKDGNARLLTPFGWLEEYDSKKVVKIVTLRIEDEIDRIAKLRKDGDEDHQLSVRGGLTGQFEGGGASLYETLISHWLYRSKRFALAATILLPALDTLYVDRDLVELTKGRMGWLVGCQMLTAFVGDRDYDRALDRAALIRERYPETQFSTTAEQFSKELPLRRNDFQELKLPTLKVWDELKKTLSREEQIRYLCMRLRLVNGFQWGQPGGVHLGCPQFAEPCGLARDASWGLNRGKTPVINPLNELCGDEREKVRGMSLTTGDIVTLAPFLKEDWHVLAVEFWRDFHPQRTIETTRGLLSKIIDDIAKQQLCGNALKTYGTDQGIEQIIAWAKENSGKSEADLLLQAIETALVAKRRFYDVESQSRRLVELKDKRAIPPLVRYLEVAADNEYNLEEILSHCRALDPAAMKDVSRKYVGHNKVGVRLQAGLILFDSGDVPGGRAVIAEALRKADYSNLSGHRFVEAVDALLKEGSPESRQTVLILFEGKQFEGLRDGRASVLRRCAKSGMVEPYRFYAAMLAVEGQQLGGTTYGDPVAKVFADEFIEIFSEGEPDLEEIAKAKERIPAVREWLNRKIAALEKK